VFPKGGPEEVQQTDFLHISAENFSFLMRLTLDVPPGLIRARQTFQP
jgi:hypothetical protein